MMPADALLKNLDDSGDRAFKPQAKVSVIIPVYNCKRYVTLAIESVRMQSWKSVELIVVDDASDDGTTELLHKILNVEFTPDIKVIYRNRNGGPAAALNDGIRASSGDYIRWLSADDMMYPNAIQDMMLFGVEDHPKLAKNAIFYSDYDIIDEHGQHIAEFIEPDRNELQHEVRCAELWSHFYGNGSTSLIHKNIFKKCGLYDENLKHSEDYEFWLRCTVLFGIELIRVPIKTIKYRRWSGQLTNTVGGSLDQSIKQSIKSRMQEITT